jgi:hypothetical protein
VRTRLDVELSNRSCTSFVSTSTLTSLPRTVSETVVVIPELANEKNASTMKVIILLWFLNRLFPKLEFTGVEINRRWM